jgi:ferredoxin
MAVINTKLRKDLRKYGDFDFAACYNCGNCTAICSLSTKESSFPREMVRYSTLGLEDEIKSSLKPWQCYYCGECTTHCPREADPGALMMSLRRWLTTQYDWTGLSGLLYKSMGLTWAAMGVVLALVLGYAFSVGFDLEKLLHTGHLFERLAIFTVGVVILLPNVSRMWYYTILKPKAKVSFKKYVTAIGELFLHMFTQKRALGCDNNQFRWFEHFILVLSYLALLFTTVFLNWFSTEYLFVHVLGYVVSGIMFVVTFDFVRHRIKKDQAVAKKSQPSDWFFVVWMFLMGLTAFFVRIFIDLDLLEGNKWLYLTHLTVLAQWALIIVPFGKWSHFLYRSFAMYFEKLKSN